MQKFFLFEMYVSDVRRKSLSKSSAQGAYSCRLADSALVLRRMFPSNGSGTPTRYFLLGAPIHSPAGSHPVPARPISASYARVVFQTATARRRQSESIASFFVAAAPSPSPAAKLQSFTAVVRGQYPPLVCEALCPGAPETPRRPSASGGPRHYRHARAAPPEERRRQTRYGVL